ncbi:28359_t:CDS:2, partial [Racocetra persica]
VVSVINVFKTVNEDAIRISTTTREQYMPYQHAISYVVADNHAIA